jgi:hypothetical protein
MGAEALATVPNTDLAHALSVGRGPGTKACRKPRSSSSRNNRAEVLLDI